MGAVQNVPALGSTVVPRRDNPTEERYDLQDGAVQLSGLQALVRLPLDQRRLDQRRGLDTGIFISGYEGSPLAGLDLQLTRQSARLDDHRVVFRPAVNEELAASAVQGSQIASASPQRVGDGVVGIWYGKAPGLDRATDAIRHGNLGGTDGNGGVLALVGDDSIAKSSTVPSSSEPAIAELGMPCVVPADPQDILDLGLHAIAMSRICGLWVAMKLSTNVVDGSNEVAVDPHRILPVAPDRTFDGREFEHKVTADLLQPTLGQLESTQVRQRLELARRYASANRLDRIIGDPDAKIGVVCAGATYLEVREALSIIGVDAATISTSGLRVLKLGMVHPLEPGIIAEFTSGLTEILVIEEKKAFIELALKNLLYGTPNAPRILGKSDAEGGELLRGDSDLPADYIAPRLAHALIRHRADSPARRWLDQRQSARRAPKMLPILQRTPYFCSGCPHNSSTRVPDGALVGGGIGCHGLITLQPPERVGSSIGLSAMGAEGAAWTGMSPFVTQEHLFQNLGDGTYHHSGSLAIRAAIASGVNITYKILYNDTVAMTGGQDAVGKLRVPQLVDELLAEGVNKVVVTSDSPKDSRHAFGRTRRLPGKVSIRHRDDLIEVQEELAEISGVTVLIHEQECATELRRKRKRGLIEAPVQRIFINERVCEGCGDCGDKSNCLSVQPVDTEFGRKTQIHQSSCNLDFSCIKGDCPSFVEVRPRASKRTPFTSATQQLKDSDLPAPIPVVGADDFSMRITGVGGTGVVTVAQVIGAAATHMGLKVTGLDQLGLAQKGGAVVSDVRISSTQRPGSNRIGAGGCDLYLGFDSLVAATQSNLEVIAPQRTYTVVSTSATPTGAMVTDIRAQFPPTQDLIDRIEWAGTRPENIFVDVRTQLRKPFDGDQFANVFLLGTAVQAGLLPVTPAAVEWALRLNGVQVEANHQAFRQGRRYVVDQARKDTARVAAAADTAAIVDCDSGSLRNLLVRNLSELIAYQNNAYARRYAEAVERMRAAEMLALGSSTVTTEYARQLYKVMAYKDEYEVGRLHLDPHLEQRIREEFGDGAQYSFLLHPPVFRVMGLDRKIKLDARWAKAAFRLLYALRILRGTPLDVFGLGKVRRAERALITDYLQAADEAAARLSPENADLIRELISLPEWVRGYEEIKMRSLQTYYTRRTAIIERLTADAANTPTTSTSNT
ncbi:Uncharacterised protein [Mycolicibacterium vanbaalenii]|uniref:Indolepyruvate ferredoxin oxidoreductase n=1 Tax=Mycolicibacterium vanbaalenii TaxID=110539 RepID=A0A5S9QPD4_MYCVN|nr:indolepyruvate ferredoxin oxidoreductase family protein [Mycolicibacterium vanbaalenii]CAA0120104.1 Uncharacterised protein [Mycolicibacterium vanbaalenii]